MSAAMTKTLRNSGVVTNGTTSADMAVGQAFVVTTFVHVEWLWLALPALAWLLGVITWL